MVVRPDPDTVKYWNDNSLEDLRYQYDLIPEDIVLDIGSYRREWADKIREKYKCYVECFDALDNKAAGTENGKIQMGGQYYYTSFFDTETPQNTYQMVDIAPYLADKITLMKMNIEGFEYVLLPYIIEKGLMANIKYLQVQFHLIDGKDTQKMYDEISEQLSLTHKISWRYPFCWESWERLC